MEWIVKPDNNAVVVQAQCTEMGESPCKTYCFVEVGGNPCDSKSCILYVS